MLRKRPVLGKTLALVVVGLYLASLLFAMHFFLPASINSSLSGIANLDRGRREQDFVQKMAVTTDGGSTWTYVEVGKNSFYNDLTCPGPQTCFVGGYRLELEGDDRYTLRTSSDGGKTWATLPTLTQQPGNSFSYTLTCPKLGHCYTLHTDKDGLSILSSRDGGLSWRQTPLNLTVEEDDKDDGAAALDCPAELVCFVAGKEGVILNTVDGGLTWREQNSGTTSTFSRLSCADSQHCVAAGIPATAVTSDGGLTWQSVSKGGFRSLDCPDFNTCYTLTRGGVDSESKLLLSRDGGLTWADLDYGVKELLSALACPDALHCYVTGASGSVRTTSDGGLTWQERKVGNSRYFSKISCPAVKTCYLLLGPDLVQGIKQ